LSIKITALLGHAMNQPLFQHTKHEEHCPQCGALLQIKQGKKGLFLGCSAYPQCDYLKPLQASNEVKTLKILEQTCPQCGHLLALKQGHFGMFIGCSNYPECHFVVHEEAEAVTQVVQAVLFRDVHVLLSFVLAVVAGLVKKIEIPWDILSLYTALLFALSFVFLSFGFLISSAIKNQEMGQGVAFLLWLILLAFLDLALMGFLMKSNVREDIIFFIALINPIEVFRIAAISLFDPNLAVIGVASNFVLNNFSVFGFVLYSIFYPLILGAIMLVGGYFIFSSRDLV